jgi:speckle-type POZ protein
LARAATLKKLPPVPTMFEITLLNSKKEVLTSNRFYDKMFDNDNKNFGKGLLKIEDVFSNSGLLHPTDELHIQCQVRYENKKNVYTQSLSQISTIASNSAANLTKRFEHLFNEGMEFNDMEIRAKGVTFPAHKVVLAAGSPVFAAMLKATGFTENKTNVLKIDDLEPPIIKEMLRFLYTDQVEKMDELAKDLLVAADKYLIDL